MRCTACGSVIGNKHESYRKGLLYVYRKLDRKKTSASTKEKLEEQYLQELFRKLGLQRLCCKAKVMTFASKRRVTQGRFSSVNLQHNASYKHKSVARAPTSRAPLVRPVMNHGFADEHAHA